ncbi:hypothetical protein [Haloprofundus sp. MHR1]|uniref:DUF7311 family protein n=1 Tax=Haloprofundus sp. MHR1 TaxID=2572921 RepID=UPI0010BEADCE|nr:hypothetical protein [Haloprofundus sp. MHR1]QCJ47570.1 hypothetical protein FCF25_10775 [Haloprofundus sp. MHR1]
MTRFVVSVALAVALVAASLPAVENARADRTTSHLDAELTRVADAARGLIETEDAVGDASLAARRVVTVSVPERSLTAASVDYVELDGGGGPTGASFGYRLAGREETTYHLADVPLSTRSGPVRLSDSGTHRLALSLVERGREPVVTLRRLEADDAGEPN